MTTVDYKKLLLGTSVLAGFAAMTFAAPVYAQTADEDEAPIQVQTVEENEEEGDEVVVTGSRLKKNTFTSTTPLQVITTDDANEQGLFSPVEILQTNAAASGQQIDSTFQGFVLDNGPGSETINLRALGANRTLVLMNSRRLAPAGVEGAPSQPSINLIPSTMVDRFDLLLDGASAVYGSDAVAGVVNVILRNDYDGLELDVFADTPEQGAGQDYTIGARYGVNSDRGFIGGAVEFTYQDPWFASDRDFLSENGCETFREVTETGEIRTVDLSDQNLARFLGIDAPTSPCRATRLTQRFFITDGNLGSVYFQPEVNNTGFGFSESSLFGVPIDGNNDGVADVSFFNFSPNGQQSEIQQIANEQSQISFFANGEYTFEGEMNITPYFEVLHADRDIKATGGQPQLFPTVPGSNPFNPCNIANNDCIASYNNLLADPGYQARFTRYLNSDRNPFGTTNCFNIPDAFCTPATFGLFDGRAPQSFATVPIVGVRGDRNVTDVSIAQTRILTGVNGDLPGINFAQFNDWSFDASVQYSFSKGISKRTGVREDRLNVALGVNPVTFADLNAPCDLSGTALSTQYLDGCVPVNLFAPSLYQSAAGGDFATQAERDYVFGTREFDTRYSQLILDATVQGDFLTLPGGEASVLLGVQFRQDEIDSLPNDIAADGLLFGFFVDEGAAGSRDTSEAFFEASLPLGTGQIGLRELNIDVAARITDDEFYGSNSTYSIKGGWRPIDSLLLKGTVGTSFRAPNLRELFLKNQSGFNNGFGDICAVPDAAFVGTLGGSTGYDRSADPRTDIVLNNCIQAGLDPTTYRAGNGVYSVEINTSGALEALPDQFGTLQPETSESYTLGFSFEQPWTDAFDFTFGATYFNLEVEDSIFEPSSTFVVNQCYAQVSGLSSPFCALVSRPFGGDIQNVRTRFFNLDTDAAEFVDYNFRFDKANIAFMDKSWDIFARGQFSNYISRTSSLTLVPGEDPIRDERVGEFGVPEWTGSITGGFTQDRWSAAWTTRYISGVESEEESLQGDRSRAVDGFTSFLDTTNTFNGAGSTVTCSGPDDGDVNCRPVFFADDYFVHSLSFTYRGDDWNLRAGVSNVFNEGPALVSPREVLSINNVPIGNGYDLNGREYFVRVRKSF